MNIEALLDSMSLEEQVPLLAGEDFWTTVAIDRLGIPKIKVTDGPNGARGGGSLVGGVKATCYPVAIALGATWNPDLVAEMGVSLAGQVKSKGASVLLAPTVNIHRSGLNGRNFECYSEDPLLSASLAVAYIEGVQSQGVAATIKHFAGNESEIERQTISSDIDERALREIYLPPFEQAVKKARVMAVMSSYNRLNGTYTSEHSWLLTEVLREQWGFDGIVMSDWFGSHSTAETVNAGLDLEMPGPSRDRGDKLVEAVRQGLVKPETVRAAAGRILTLLQRVGAFEAAPDLSEHAHDLPQDRALIRRLGAEGAVLLKNEDDVLPLAKSSLRRVAVIGPNAAQTRVMGGGSAQINAHYSISPLDGLRAALDGGADITHAVGCSNGRLAQLFDGPVEARYYKGSGCQGEPVATITEQNGEFFWFDLPSPDLSLEDFSVRMVCTFTAAEDGPHLLGMTNAGFAKLYVDGELVIDGATDWRRGENFFGTANSEIREVLDLRAGRSYTITVDYLSPPPADYGINITAIRFGIEKVLGDEAMDEAVETAQAADVAIVFVGRNGQWDTEGQDLPDMRLPGRQEELIERVSAANPNCIVVLQTGGPVEMPWLDKVRAVLQFWYPGQELGHAVADVLFGDQEPGGRLPQTFPRRLTDNASMTGDPSVYPGKDGHVRYAEGVFIGYRHHDARGVEPLFPFGFGLGYTSFRWEAAEANTTVMTDEGIEVSVRVTNTGARAGSDVVQLYVEPPGSDIERPVKELRAFAKIALQPGETGTVTLSVMPRDLSYFDIDAHAFRSLAGRYRLVIGAHVQDRRSIVDIELPQEWRGAVNDRTI